MQITVERLTGPPPDAVPVEVVERKGKGHPDTLCDRAAEEFSLALSRHYLAVFGRVLHHNVDKCLLVGGRSEAYFGGGEVLLPMRIYLAGRATEAVDATVVPVEELGRKAAREAFESSLRALDFDRHVQVEVLARRGSRELVDTFQAAAQMPAAGDTSFGVGRAPLTPLERLVLEVEGRLTSEELQHRCPALGEDVKVMGARVGDAVELTVAVAFLGSRVDSLRDYLEKKEWVERQVGSWSRDLGAPADRIFVNAADDPSRERVYLTVTGTSAEAGDDGEVGRGNRMGGLITPCRWVSLEATAGKNPHSHVGKIYNVLASQLAEELAAHSEVQWAEVLVLSRIGRPLNEPSLVHLRLYSSLDTARLVSLARPLVEAALGNLQSIWDGLLASRYRLF